LVKLQHHLVVELGSVGIEPMTLGVSKGFSHPGDFFEEMIGILQYCGRLWGQSMVFIG
jgi:hypothetical protein